MPYAPLLSEEEVALALGRVPEWTREGDAILRTIRCPSFREAIALVVSVADAAEAADHHPDMLIRWRRVAFTLSTHASGGLTAKDFALAAEIDRLATRIGAA
ncbi:MAG: 4a-hydroxytetrahydrobiopterin dehydratase [Chloroflexi bacterium]|nr:MAG: 4a-hydroxytetrahydrobiopterin dehydratase [Chloroflexota bacterium]